MMSIKKPSFLKSMPFSNLSKEPSKLPYIPTIINEDDNELKKEIYILKKDNLPEIRINLSQPKKASKGINLNFYKPKREKIQFQSFDFNSKNNINDDSISNNENITSIYQIDKPKYHTKLEKLKRRFRNKSNNFSNNITHSKNCLSGVFLTNLSQRLTTDNSINNYSNNFSPLSLSRVSSGNKKKIITVKNRVNLVKSLDFLNKEIKDDYDNMKEQFDDYNDYEKFMKNKCDNMLKYYDRRFKIQSDEFINERIEKIKTEGLNYKFNKYFDKFFSMKKNFDLVAMSKLLLKHRTNKKKLEKEINEKKIQKQREKYINLIEQNVERAKKVQMLSDEYMRKNNRLKNKNINSNNYDNNDINEIEDDNE